MALDGIILRGECVPSSSYMQTLLGYMTPASSVSGADTYTWWYYVSGSNMAQLVLKNNVFYQTNTLFAAPGPNCDTSQIRTDALSAVGAVLALWITVAAAMAVVRFFRTPGLEK